MSYNSLFGLGSHAEDVNLERWWKLQDDAASTVVVDSSSNNVNGTASVNTDTLAIIGPNLWLPSAFNINSESLFLGFAAYLNGASGATFLLRVNLDLVTDNDTLFSDWDSDGNGHVLCRMGGSGELEFFTNNTSQNGGTLTPATALSTSAGWQSVSFRFNSGQRTGGVDGTYDSTTSGGSSLTSTATSGMQVAGTPHTIARLDGQAVDAVIFSRSLSDAEILQWDAGPEPLNTVPPTLSGTLEVGDTLTSTSGTWDNQSNGSLAYTYQWYRADDSIGTGAVLISGETATTYVIQNADTGYFLLCKVSASNSGGVDVDADTFSEAIHVASLSYNQLFGLGSHTEDPSIEGWWELQDDAASTVVVDSSSNGRDITFDRNTDTVSTTGPGGGFAKAFDFSSDADGSTTDTTLISLPQTYSMTVLCRVNPDISGNAGAAISFDGTDDIILYPNDSAAGSGGVRLFWRDLGGNLVSESGSNQTGVWGDYAFVTRSSTSHETYRDGSSVGSSSSSGSAGPFSTFRIGRWASQHLNAQMVDVVVFGRDLTVAEIIEWGGKAEPLNTAQPSTPSGTQTEGQTLTANDGSWDSQSNASIGGLNLTYQWVRANDGAGSGAADIGGETSATYVLQAADVGEFISCRVIASNDGGNDSAEDTTSTYTGAIASGLATAFSDSFTDTNGTSLAAHTPDTDAVGGGWIETNGTWQIQTNKAQTSGADPGAPNWLATFDGGNSDGILNVEVSSMVANTDSQGLIFRYTDASNFWVLVVQRNATNTIRIRKREAGAYTNMTSLNDISDVDNYSLSVELNGDSIQGYIDGVPLTLVTNTFNQSAQIYGMIQEVVNNCQFDDLNLAADATTIVMPIFWHHYSTSRRI